VEPRCLPEGRCDRSGGWGGFGNDVVGMSLDLLIRFAVEHCDQEGLDAVEAEVVSGDCGGEFEDVTSKVVVMRLQTHKTRGWKV